MLNYEHVLVLTSLAASLTASSGLILTEHLDGLLALYHCQIVHDNLTEVEDILIL